MDCRVIALSWAEHGELQSRSWRPKTLIIGEYLPPSYLDHLPDLEEALNRFPSKYPVVLGDQNKYIGRIRNPRDQQVADFLVSFGLVDLLAHF